MANEFSKASFVAARKLYFEQIAANTNSPIDSRRTTERLKRNALSDSNIAEDNISSSSFEHYSSLHKASSHSNLIPARNNELHSILLNNNSKIPIPGSHSPLIKSINVDSEDNEGYSKSSLSDSKGKLLKYQNTYESNYVSYIKDMTNPTNKKLSENNMPEKMLDSKNIKHKKDEIPETPKLKPTPVSSPLIVANSKLPIPTSIKDSKEIINKMDDIPKENTNENKGWFAFTKERAPGWFALAKEKVNSANSWLAISRVKPDQEQKLESNKNNRDNENEGEKDDEKENRNKQDSDDKKENEIEKIDKDSKDHEKNKEKNNNEKVDENTNHLNENKNIENKDNLPSIVQTKNESTMFHHLSSQISPSLSVTKSNIYSESKSSNSSTLEESQEQNQSQLELPLVIKQVENKNELKKQSKSSPIYSSSEIKTEIVTMTKSPVQPSPIQSPTQVKVQINSQTHSSSNASSSAKIENETPKEKIEKPPITNNENTKSKSSTARPLNMIFNNTQNFIYKNSNLNISNQSLNSNTSTSNTEKLDDSVMTGDELIIDDEDLTSATIAFDKKVLQKIDNYIPQERNDSEAMNKRKKRTSFGSSSLSKTINKVEEEEKDSYIKEGGVRNKNESMRNDPVYKYLRNKNDIVHQNFNTEKNRYEDDSDAASYYDDSDGYLSNEIENRKEVFEDRLKMKSKYFINGRKSFKGEKKNGISNTVIVSKKIKPSLPVPILPTRKSSTSNLTSKIIQDSRIPTPSKEKLKYKEKSFNSSQTINSPPTRSLSTTSNGSSHVRATSPLTMYSRVNEDLDFENKPKTYNIVKTEPIMIDRKPDKPERLLKYKPPRRSSSSLNRTNKHTRNKKSQDYSINEHSSIFIDAPPERGRSVFKGAREFSNKSHSIDIGLSKRGNGRENRNRSPDYQLKSGMNERGRGRTRTNIIHEISNDEDDNIPLIFNKNINTRKYLKKYLDKREGQRSQSVDASKSKNHRRNDSDEYLNINNEFNDDTMYITELLNANFLDHDNDKGNIFYTNRLTPRSSSLQKEKYSSVISSASSISSISSTSSSASSMTNSTTDLNKNNTVNSKLSINDSPIDSYYKVSGVIKHNVVPIGNSSILYGEDNSYSLSRSNNNLYNNRSSITLNRYNYQKLNKNQKRVSSSSSTAINDDETSLIFGNLPEEIYNFLKPELDIPAPSRTSSRESIQSSDSKRYSISSLHHSLTLNDESDNDETTLRNNSGRLQASIIKEEVEIPKPLTDAQKRVQKIISEILSTERTYVKELSILINIYIEPLKKNRLLEQEEFNSIFANIEDIYNFHSKSFLPPLEAVCNKDDAKISKFFLDISRSFENFYSKYYYAFNGANTLLSLVQANNNHNVRIPNLSSSASILNLPLFERSSKKRLKKFRAFLKNCVSRPDHTQLSLQGYLILPVQRLPRYLLLIEQLVKYSKDDPVEKEENEKAAELMKKVVESCNSYMKQCEEKHVLLEIITKHIRLDSNDSHSEIVDNYTKIQGLIRVSGAKLIRKGDLQILRSVTSIASIFPSKRVSSEFIGRNSNIINPTVRCSSALSMATTATSSTSRTYNDSKNNGSRLSSSNESIHSVSTNATYVQSSATTSLANSSNYKRSSTSVLDIKKNQTTDSIDGILVNVLDLENCTEEPASFSSTSSEFIEIESKKTDIVLIVSDCKTQLYLTSPDIDSVYSWHQTINKQWRALKKIEKKRILKNNNKKYIIKN
ncbi:hypothetical protein BCR36DRAFT_371740 [Piromyces finnis]|uniref:DH domain-containing protein n=1 Tax=Piromyces finnis TaxID=1754191 RepID=A0A1Y1V4R4_9FUNG|nr:hypothetical protein BCR36DRAFT_371740 [Piromyces finnis]|eukprot:ORX47255.1 hypothetical protein BCR36DRAFT_371740 [Piromyces finnis]